MDIVETLSEQLLPNDAPHLLGRRLGERSEAEVPAPAIAAEDIELLVSERESGGLRRELCVRLHDRDPERARAIFEALERRLASSWGRGKRTMGVRRFRRERPECGEGAEVLTMSSFREAPSGRQTIKLIARLEQGFAVDEAARALATATIDETRCRAALERWLAGEADVPRDEVDAIVGAVRSQRPDEATLVACQVLALLDWDDVSPENMATIGRVLSLLAETGGETPGLLRVGARDFTTLFRIISAVHPDRHRLVSDLIDWLDAGYEAARCRLTPLLMRARSLLEESQKAHEYRLDYDGRAETNLRAFALLTDGLGGLAPAMTYVASEKHARIRLLPVVTATLGDGTDAERPAAADGCDEGAAEKHRLAEATVAFLAALRRRFPAAFAACLPPCLAAIYSNPLAFSTLLALGVDEEECLQADLRYWRMARLGTSVVVHTGKDGQYGTLRVHEHVSPELASADFAARRADKRGKWGYVTR